MIKIKSVVIGLLSLFVIVACKQTSKTNNQTLIEAYTPKYAKGFSLKTSGSDKILEVKNPWQGANNVDYSYTLTNKADPNNFNEIEIPVKRAICMSSSHIAFIDTLGKTDNIIGVSGIKYIYNKSIQQKESTGLLQDVGSSSNISYEKIISLKPDVIFAYGVENEFSIIEDKLKELGIKTVYIGDYLENTPLGKTEWLLAFSTFFNEEELAKDIFSTIESEYNTTMEICNAVVEKPNVVFNTPFNDVWYMPGGNNYMSKYTSDAGAKYLLQDNNKRESSVYSIEDAYLLALDADYWILSDYSKSLTDVLNSDTRFKNLPAFKSGNVYNCSKRLTENGGNDFWESGVMKPHIILKDFIKIYHPNLLPEYELFYYQRLK